MKTKFLILICAGLLLTGCGQITVEKHSTPTDFKLNQYVDGPVMLEAQNENLKFERYLNKTDDLLIINDGDDVIKIYNDNSFNTYVDINGDKYYTDSVISPSQAVENIDIHLNEPLYMTFESDERIVVKKNFVKYKIDLDENGNATHIESEDAKISVTPCNEIDFDTEMNEYEYMRSSSLLVKILDVLEE